jgi:hypothetical protein
VAQVLLVFLAQTVDQVLLEMLLQQVAKVAVAMELMAVQAQVVQVHLAVAVAVADLVLDSMHLVIQTLTEAVVAVVEVMEIMVPLVFLAQVMPLINQHLTEAVGALLLEHIKFLVAVAVAVVLVVSGT